MSRPIIAVDIDEVLGRHNHALAAWHNKEFGTDHTEDAYTTTDWALVWHTSPAEAERRAVVYHREGVHRRLEVLSGAQESLEQLAQRFDLVVITVRRKDIINITHEWLQEFFPCIFREVKFLHFWDDGIKTTKAEIAKELGASYLIDDDVKHCRLAAEMGIEALLFGDYSWNKTDSLPVGVNRVKSWQEVMEYFHER